MKSLFLLLVIGLFSLSMRPVMAQVDTLSMGDTISVSRQPTLFGAIRQYRYYQAMNLAAGQLEPILKRSPAVEVPALVRRYNRNQRQAGVTYLIGLGAMSGGIITLFRRPETGLLLSLGGLGLTFISPFMRSEYLVERAVNYHNTALRSQTGDYYRPLFDIRSGRERLSLADSVRVKRHGLGYRFTYRSVELDPASQLLPAFEQLRNGRLTGNMRYVRTVRTITGMVSGIATGLLSSYLLIYSARRTAGYYPFNWGFATSTAGVIALGAVANWHTNLVQAGTMREYNTRLKERKGRKVKGGEEER